MGYYIKENAPSNWHGAMTTYVDQQTGRHSSDRPAGRQYNLLAFESAMVPATPSISDRPDQTGLTEQAQQAKENAVVMNRVLTKIEQGSEVLQPEEYKIRVTQEPKRVFPMSDVMETTLACEKTKIFRPSCVKKVLTLTHVTREKKWQSTRTHFPDWPIGVQLSGTCW